LLISDVVIFHSTDVLLLISDVVIFHSTDVPLLISDVMIFHSTDVLLLISDVVIFHSTDVLLFLYAESNSGPADVTCSLEIYDMLHGLLRYTFRCVHLAACLINSCVAGNKVICYHVLRATDLPYQTALRGALFRLLHKHVQQPTLTL
jgi:hypothetical protein